MESFEIVTDDLIENLRKLKAAKEMKEFREKQFEEAKTVMQNIEAECVLMMDSANVTKLTVDGVTCYRRTDKYASVVQGMQDLAFAWLRENDLDFLIKETVNSRSLGTALKELPPDTPLPESIKVFEQAHVGMRKS